MPFRPGCLDAAYRARQLAGRTQAGPIRTTPVALLPRRIAPLWNRATPALPDIAPAPSSRARIVADYLRNHGAAFYDEIVDGTGLLRTHVEEALAELVALGAVTSDSFAGLRALLTPSEKRKPLGGRRRHRRAIFDIADSGRWALQKRLAIAGAFRSGPFEPVQPEIEHIVLSLLRRYGVCSGACCIAKAPGCRRGAFCCGSSTHGGARRASRRTLRCWRVGRTVRAARGSRVVAQDASRARYRGVCGGQRRRSVESGRRDAAGAKVPALAGNRVLYLDGIAVATLVGGAVQWLEPLDAGQRNSAESLLIQRRTGAPLLAYLR